MPLIIYSWVDNGSPDDRSLLKGYTGPPGFNTTGGRAYVPFALTLRQGRAHRLVPPGGGNSLSFQAFIDSVLVGAPLAFGAADTEASANLNVPVHVINNILGTECFEGDPTGFPAFDNTQIAIHYTGDAPNEQYGGFEHFDDLQWTFSGFPTSYASLHGSSISLEASPFTDSRTPWPVSGEFKHLALVGFDDASFFGPGINADTGISLTLRKNGVDTALSTVVSVSPEPDPGVFSLNSSTTVSVSAGDFIGFAITVTGGSVKAENGVAVRAYVGFKAA